MTEFPPTLFFTDTSDYTYLDELGPVYREVVTATGVTELVRPRTGRSRSKYMAKTVTLGPERSVGDLWPDEKTQLAVVKRRPALFQWISEAASDHVKLAALAADPKNIRWIKAPTREMLWRAVNVDGVMAYAGQHDMGTAFYLTVLRHDPTSISDMQDPIEILQLEAIHRDPRTVRFIKNPTERVQSEVVHRRSFSSIVHPSIATRIKALRKGYFDPYVTDLAYRQAAVRRKLVYMMHMSLPIEEAVHLAAVQRHFDALKVIHNPSEAIQLAAVQADGRALQYIPDPSREVVLAAIAKWGSAIKYISDPDPDLQLAAVKRDRRALKYIANPAKEVSKLFT